MQLSDKSDGKGAASRKKRKKEREEKGLMNDGYRSPYHSPPRTTSRAEPGEARDV